MAFVPASTVPPLGDTSGLTLDEQLKDVQQRRAMAQALMTQGSQGVNAGPFYVAPSPLATIAKTLASAYVSSKLAGQQRDLQVARAKQLGDSLNALMGAGQAGTARLPAAAPPAAPDQAPGTQPQPSTPPDTGAAPPPLLDPNTPPASGAPDLASALSGKVPDSGISDNGGPGGIPEVTVNASRLPPAANPPPVTPAGASGAPATAPAATASAATDPLAARHQAALEALRLLPLDLQQQIVGQVSGQLLTPPKPPEPFTLGPGQQHYDAAGNLVARANPLPEDELGKLEMDRRNGLMDDATYQARRAMLTNPGVRYEDRGDALVPVNAKTGAPMPNLKPIPKNLTPAQARQATMFDGQSGALMAALADRGVSLPAGFRSREQQKALIDGLVARHPDMTPDEIADGISSGQLSFAGNKKAVTVAGGQAGKVSLGLNEIQQFAPLALQASANVPRGSFMPLNRLMQMGQAQISDPALRDLQVKTQAVLNAYDQVAARGGTDVGKRNQAHALLMAADSPETYAVAVKGMMQEAQAAEQAAQNSVSGFSKGGSGGATPGVGAGGLPAGWSVVQH